MPTGLADITAVLAAGYKVTQTDRGTAFGAERFQTTIMKPIAGAATTEGGARASQVGFSGVSQAAADAVAVAALNNWRNHRYGTGAVLSTGSRGGTHTLDVT